MADHKSAIKGDSGMPPLAAAEDVISATSTRRSKPRKMYGRRNSAAVKSVTTTSSFGGMRRGKGSSVSSGSLFSNPGYAFSSSLDDLGELEENADYKEIKAIGLDNDDVIDNSSSNRTFGSADSLEVYSNATNASYGRTKRGAKKKRSNIPPIFTTPSSATSSASSSSSIKEVEPAVRRSIFSSTKTDLSELDFEQEAKEVDAKQGVEDSPQTIETRGVVKRSKVVIRRSQSVSVPSCSSTIFEENLHPNESSPKRRSSCVDKKSLSQESTSSFQSSSTTASSKSVAPKTSTTRRQVNSKKRTATSGTDSERAGDFFHHDLEPSPPKIAAIRSFSSASVGSFSASGNDGLIFCGESFSSLAKRGSSQCWASVTATKSHTLSKSATLFQNRFGCHKNLSASPTQRTMNSHHRSRSQPVGVDLAEIRPSVPLFFSPPEIILTPSVRSSTSSRKRGISSSPSIFEEGFEGDEATPTSGQSYGSFKSKARSRVSSSPSIPSHDFAGSSLHAEICLTGSDSKLLNCKEDADARDVDSDNESVLSASDVSGDEFSSSSEDEHKLIEPEEMSDADIFTSKPSDDDFKHLAKVLKRWNNSLSSDKSATMGLSNGCLVAIPSDWSGERRNNFIKWSVTAFGFRVGSVGGIQAGAFLRCTLSEGKGIFDTMKRILSGYKAGKFDSTAETNIKEGPSSMLFSPVADENTPRARLGLTQRSMSSGSGNIQSNIMSSFPFCDDFVQDQLVKDMEEKAFIDEKKEAEKCKLFSRSSSLFLKAISLQPLSKVKSPNLPCLRSSPGIHSSGAHRPQRLSNEHAIDSCDLMSQIHGVIPSPVNGRGLALFNRRLSCRSSKKQPQLPRYLNDEPNTPSQFLFLSPHPRNNSLSIQTPLHQDFLETPMPKKAENWGSQPIPGKDWGASQVSSEESMVACGEVFAKAWFSSDFHDSEAESNEYRMHLSDDTEIFLMGYFDEIEKYDRGGVMSDDDFEDSIVFGKCEGGKPGNFIFSRSDSVGGTALALLHLSDDVEDFTPSPKHNKRRSMKIAKLTRMSLCAAATDFHAPKQRLRFSNSPIKKASVSHSGETFQRIIRSTLFSAILSFLDERELIHIVSLVCTSWADAAADALSTLMLVSVGCDPTHVENRTDDDSDLIDELDSLEINDEPMRLPPTSKSMEIDWDLFINRFPWAQYLSDGAFKRVYRVWNNDFNVYEAISVMNVNEIIKSGNLNLVGAELAVSVLLSSLSRRNICPNFVITRGVFTCQHEPPRSHWGCEENRHPRGTTFDGLKFSQKNIYAPSPGDCGSYQYIRMEFCDHGDMEHFLRKLPGKTLDARDCQTLLFQMAFALHVAGDRYGLKHYDVKLLNFFLRSANEPGSDAVEDRPHTVLRYGLGSHVFRLRMHPSRAFFAKLADYGTSILNDTNGQPITIAQFTTFENTPPDYLILGNVAEQGYGHDCFCLGLCMLHLFTGHAPYEEILEEVQCPENLKSRLRKVWNSKPYDVIRSAMYYIDSDGNESEDETLYNTLYRYLVLFGIPEHQFCAKKRGKVWRAINETLKSSSNYSKTPSLDAAVFEKDRTKYSLARGNHEIIANARRRLEEIDGAMEILLSLVSFDPKKRATPIDVINSKFMSGLIEDPTEFYDETDVVKSYTAYLTK
mmetsp:Transcript_25409/g.52610  ORF Transcript_25409/g.52610 Transcript_25409/m.52610 type:complete len:1640 (-) Transcript_25409:224-5143(-)